ncbi:unnamed protein product [Closterium sp. Naga37s-1]|nr:unnamed protein product [Closterium sp. Naga37s-1]
MVAGGESGTSGGEGEGDTYAVVVDAVSAESSSVHVYRFDSRMELGEIQKGFEVVHSVKPGLGAYGDNVTAAANSLRPLMKKALKAVPEFSRPISPVLVRANGGQGRLLGDQADKILAEIRQMLTEYPFPFSHGDVSVLDDSDAGFFAWTAVNHLLGNLGKHLKNHLESTVAVVDLGNTSVHVAYAVPADVAKKVPAGHVRRLSGQQAERERDEKREAVCVDVAMQGYGRMAGRALVLKATNDTHNHPCMHVGSHGTSKPSSDGTAASLQAALCSALKLPHPLPLPLPHMSPTHPTAGTSKPSSDGTSASLRAALCSSLTLQALQRAAAAASTTSASSSTTGSADSHPSSAHASSDAMLRSAAPVCPQGRACLLPGALDGLRGALRRGGRGGRGGGEGAVRLAATSGIFHMAQQFGLIPRNNSTTVTTAAPTAARITAQHLARIAEETCGIPLQEVSKKFPLMNGQDAPYACLDASYLFHLLTSGLGMEPTDPLTPVKQAAHNAPSTEAAWAWHYGAAVSTTMHAHAYAVF